MKFKFYSSEHRTQVRAVSIYGRKLIFLFPLPVVLTRMLYRECLIVIVSNSEKKNLRRSIKNSF